MSFHVEVQATGRSLVQSSPKIVMCLSVISKPQQRGGLETMGLSSHVKNLTNNTYFNSRFYLSFIPKLLLLLLLLLLLSSYWQADIY